VGKYLTTLDRKTSVAELSRLDSISGKDLFFVLMTKFLGKSGQLSNIYIYACRITYTLARIHRLR